MTSRSYCLKLASKVKSSRPTYEAHKSHTKLYCQAIHLYRLKLPQIATRQEKQKCKRHNTTGPYEPYELRDDSDEERTGSGFHEGIQHYRL